MIKRHFVPSDLGLDFFPCSLEQSEAANPDIRFNERGSENILDGLNKFAKVFSDVRCKLTDGLVVIRVKLQV